MELIFATPIILIVHLESVDGYKWEICDIKRHKQTSGAPKNKNKKFRCRYGRKTLALSIPWFRKSKVDSRSLNEATFPWVGPFVFYRKHSTWLDLRDSGREEWWGAAPSITVSLRTPYYMQLFWRWDSGWSLQVNFQCQCRANEKYLP